jgi:DNA gyrase/topoisomerase IV subunit B
VPTEPHYDASKIEILPGRELVRKRPAMYIGPLDRYASHSLIWAAIDGLVWHYRSLGQVLDRVSVCLEEDGSAVMKSYSQEAQSVRGQSGPDLLQRELQNLGVGASSGLFFVTALSSHLHAEAYTSHDMVYSFTFEQGLLRDEDLRTAATEVGVDIRLTFWPDFTILERGSFALSRTLELARSFADSDPSVTVEVVSTQFDVE